MNSFLSGVFMAHAAMIGLFFFRFWKKSGERIFFIFASAFWLLALERVALLATNQENETQSFVYLLRLFAFVLIIYGIIDKNRQTPS